MQQLLRTMKTHAIESLHFWTLCGPTSRAIHALIHVQKQFVAQPSLAGQGSLESALKLYYLAREVSSLLKLLYHVIDAYLEPT